MKSIFAIIGFIVCAMWVYHFAGNKTFRSGAKTAWDFSSPYINNAVNQAQNDTKRTVKR